MKADLNKAFADGLTRLEAAAPYLRFDVDWNAGIAIIACLQLSLRHPGNCGDSARLVRHVLDEIIASIERVEPVLAELLRLGDNPQHDVTQPVKP